MTGDSRNIGNSIEVAALALAFAIIIHGWITRGPRTEINVDQKPTQTSVEKAGE
jgi:hypothetical protein